LGLVSFNDSAVVDASLTQDHESVLDALDRVTYRQFTRIDLGISVATAELRGPHRKPHNRPVMILLTDGIANPVPIEVAEQTAVAAKQGGVTVITVGFGEPHEVDHAALGRIASSPRHYFQSPRADELVAIFESLLPRLPCP
jgi:Mg-chelatase subunit ChlD